MLVLSRKLQQEILIGDNVKVTVLKVKGNTVRLGIEAPRSVRVVRAELPPIEETTAEVTVVFADQDLESSVEKSVGVVPFRAPQEPTKNQSPRDRSRGTPGNLAGPASISFKNRLPKTLQHNRLQQIVREISNNDV